MPPRAAEVPVTRPADVPGEAPMQPQLTNREIAAAVDAAYEGRVPNPDVMRALIVSAGSGNDYHGYILREGFPGDVVARHDPGSTVTERDSQQLAAVGYAATPMNQPLPPDGTLADGNKVAGATPGTVRHRRYAPGVHRPAEESPEVSSVVAIDAVNLEHDAGRLAGHLAGLREMREHLLPRASGEDGDYAAKLLQRTDAALLSLVSQLCSADQLTEASDHGLADDLDMLRTIHGMIGAAVLSREQEVQTRAAIGRVD